jgi:hypothetical protein
LPKFQL